MGLIRKTLAVGTVGVVSGSSKKQRVAKAQLRELQAIREAIAPTPPRIYNTAPRATSAEQDRLKAGVNDLARAHNANPTPESWSAYLAARQDASDRGVIFNC
jgi:citrate lyase beta subunit